MFKTVVADPPWTYRNVNTGGSMKSGSAAKYSTMHLNEIMDMPVREIADKNSVLFLWVTTPLLPDGFEVMKAWGYTYKTSIYWRKIMSLGMGYWFRGQVEVCLLGIRGKVPAFRCQHANIIQSKVRAHSQKPEEFWNLVEPYCADPRLELFCRGTPRTGWVGWGIDCAQDAAIVELDDYMMGLAMEKVIEEEERKIQEEDAKINLHPTAPPRESPCEGPMYRGIDVDNIG